MYLLYGYFYLDRVDECHYVLEAYQLQDDSIKSHILESVKTTSIENESTDVLCRE